MDKIISRIIAAIPLALFGALTGLFCVAMATSIATEFFDLGLLENSARGDRLFVTLVCVMTASGAVVGALFGASVIPGRIGTALKGMAWGVVVGLLAGATLGFVLASTSKSPADMAAGLTMGIFWGVYIGAIVGGVIGGTATFKSEKKTPSLPASGVHDRELDG